MAKNHIFGKVPFPKEQNQNILPINKLLKIPPSNYLKLLVGVDVNYSMMLCFLPQFGSVRWVLVPVP